MMDAPATHMMGVYAIVSRADGRVYIGSTTGIRNRTLQHRSGLERGVHGNPRLQATYNEFGITNFEFVVLEVFTNICEEALHSREEFYINAYKARDESFGFNIREVTASTRGIPCSDETKIKIGMSHMGRTASDLTKERMSDTRKGRKQTPEHAANRALAVTGVKHSPESCAINSRAQLAFAASHRGELNPHYIKEARNPEHKKALEKGRRQSDRMRRKAAGEIFPPHELSMTPVSVRTRVIKEYRAAHALATSLGMPIPPNIDNVPIVMRKSRIHPPQGDA